MDLLREQIKRHEGLRLHPYQDSRGVWTIGYGHTGPITLEAAEVLLNQDIARAVSDFYRMPDWIDKLDITRKRVLVNMIFNLGLQGLKTFKKMLSALERKDYQTAAIELLDSKYARQVGSRAEELAKQLLDGDKC